MAINSAQGNEEYERLCDYVEMERVTADWPDGQLLCWSTVAEIDSRGLPIPPKDVLSIEGRKDAPMWYGCADKEWEGLDDRQCL